MLRVVAICAVALGCHLIAASDSGKFHFQLFATYRYQGHRKRYVFFLLLCFAFSRELERRRYIRTDYSRLSIFIH